MEAPPNKQDKKTGSPAKTASPSEAMQRVLYQLLRAGSLENWRFNDSIAFMK